MGAKSVLLVEDVTEMQEFLAHLLERISGVSVSGRAGNTAEARLELRRRRPDVVILDEILPGESAYDLLPELKKAGIPVILVTGVQNPTHPIPKGVRGRLIKPDWDSLADGILRFEKMIKNG